MVDGSKSIFPIASGVHTDIPLAYKDSKQKFILYILHESKIV